MDEKTLKNFQVRYMGRNTINDLIETLNTYLNEQENVISDLKEKLNNYNKDTEVKKLKDEISDLKHRSITLSDKEIKAINKFKREHFKSCKNKVNIVLESSSIGTGVFVKCSKCGREENVTDYALW